MSSAFTGPASQLGIGMRQGVESYFRKINSMGGLHGRPLELVALDDAYEPGKTAPNMRVLTDEEKGFRGHWQRRYNQQPR